MPTIIVTNSHETALGVQVEPWAMYETLAPGERAQIEFDEVVGQIEFTLTKDGDAFIGINSDITFTVAGRVIFDSRI